MFNRKMLIAFFLASMFIFTFHSGEPTVTGFIGGRFLVFSYLFFFVFAVSITSKIIIKKDTIQIKRVLYSLFIHIGFYCIFYLANSKLATIVCILSIAIFVSEELPRVFNNRNRFIGILVNLSPILLVLLIFIISSQVMQINTLEIRSGFPYLFDQHIESVKKNGGAVNPRDFGAVGDGISDDTDALQAWLDSPGENKVLGNGTYKITSGLISSKDGVTMKSDGAVILADSPNIIMLTVSGDNNEVSLELDGNNRATGGVLIKGAGCELNKSKIENIYGGNQTAFGIQSQTSGGVRIENNTIKNIIGTENGKFGDNMGAARAILVTSNASATEMNIVKNNTIDGVLGEEGDGIQFLFNNGSFSFLDAKGIIQNNTIKNCNRRAIKVQASNVKVLNNIHLNTLTLNELPNAANLIDVIHSNDILVQDNTLDARFFLGIKLSGSSNNKASRIVVKGNKIRGGLTLSSGNRASTNGISWNYVQDCDIVFNSISDSVFPISGSNGINLTINNNRFWGGDGLNPAINIVSSNSKIEIANNKLISGKRSYLIINYASK